MNALNISRLKAVNQALAQLGQEFVFVGGSVVSLYSERIAEEPRPTEDVDVVVEIYTRMDYVQMEEQLRVLGFQPDSTSGFVGRYLLDELVVDFMPLDEQVLGFNNRWYVDGFKQATLVPLDEENTIKIFPAPYFLAAKLEAFKSRKLNADGKPDGRFSDDFEDIVFLLVNRAGIWKEMAETGAPLKKYLQHEFTQLLENPYFEEWIDAHTGYTSPASQMIVLPQTRIFLKS